MAALLARGYRDISPIIPIPLTEPANDPARTFLQKNPGHRLRIPEKHQLNCREFLKMSESVPDNPGKNPAH